MAPEIRLVEDQVRELEGEVHEVEREIKLDDQTARQLLKEVQILNQELKQRGCI